MAQRLSIREVQHVARLARLRLDEARLELYRDQLSTVLDHIRTLGELDLADVEPGAQPSIPANRLSEDVIEPSLTQEQVQRIAPAVEGPFIAVPKVLGDGAGP